jgi:gas vesicle protein
MEDDSKFSYFFLGLGLGVAAGLLFAPKSGPETRELLRSKADEGKEYLKKRSNEVRDQAADAIERGKASAADAIERGKSSVLRQRENLTAAVEAGKQAYRDAVSSTPNDSVEGI